MRKDPTGHVEALAKLEIKTTKATPTFLPTVKLFMEVDAKTAAFYAQALRRAEAAKTECEEIVEFFSQPGGIGGPGRHRKKHVAELGTHSESSAHDEPSSASTASSEQSEQSESESEDTEAVEKQAKKILHRRSTLARVDAREKGKSALALSRDLGMSYKACFVLAHKLREAMAEEMKGRIVGGVGKVSADILAATRSPRITKSSAATAGRPRTRTASVRLP
jgi:hypothetical protein